MSIRSSIKIKNESSRNDSAGEIKKYSYINEPSKHDFINNN